MNEYLKNPTTRVIKNEKKIRSPTQLLHQAHYNAISPGHAVTNNHYDDILRYMKIYEQQQKKKNFNDFFRRKIRA